MPFKSSWFAGTALLVSSLFLAGCPGLGIVLTPELSLSQIAFSFDDSVTEDTFTISNTGGGTMTWSIVPAEVPTWLDLNVLSGSITDESQVVRMTVNANATLLAPGTYRDEFTVTSNGGDRVVFVTLVVRSAGSLVVTPELLEFGATTTVSSFTIRNGGTELLSWEITSVNPNDEWLSLAEGTVTSGSITSGTVTIQVVVDRSALDPGDYEGTIELTSDGGDATVTVTMTVGAPVPVLSVAPAVLPFSTMTTQDRLLVIRNTGTGTLRWTIDTAGLPSWLTVSSASGNASTAPIQVTVTANATTLEPGDYTAMINVSAEDTNGMDVGAATVTVNLTVPPPVPVLNVSPLFIDLSTDLDDNFFSIENTGTGELEWELTVNDPWISIQMGDPTSGTQTLDNQIIDFSVDRDALTAGDQEGTITITSNGGNATVTIALEVLPPTLAVVPQTLNFSTNITSKLVAIFNEGIGTVNWSIDTTDWPVWLRDAGNAPLITQTSGTVSGDDTDGITIGVNRGAVDPGNYSFASPGIVVNSDAGTIAIRVFMTVPTVPTIEVVGDGVNLGTRTIFVGAGLDNEDTFTIANTGTGTLEWSIDPTQFEPWLTIDPVGPAAIPEGAAPQTISVLIDRGDLEFGAYTDKFFIMSNDPSNPKQEVEVQMNVPRRVIIGTVPTSLSFAPNENTALLGVANFGDPDSVLRFELEVDKDWLFAFPTRGRSIGVVDPSLFPDLQTISLAVDRSGLDGAGAGVATITVYALDEAGNRDTSIAMPFEVPVSVEASPLFFEVPPARLRVPSLVRYIMLMRDIRFQPIPLETPLLPSFNRNFTISEEDQPLEDTETEQFLTSAENLKTDVVILLDYSGSTFASAAVAQSNHVATGSGTFPDFPTADDPLQYIYEQCIGSLIEELPEHYNIAIMEFHDRNQPLGRLVTDGFIKNTGAGRLQLLSDLDNINVTSHGATELIPAILDASSILLGQNIALPSTNPVSPVIPFDDADLKGVILVSDGRATTGVTTLEETAQILQGNRVTVYSVAWGEDFNAGPMAFVSSESGGHLYITRSVVAAPAVPGGDGMLTPSIDQLFEWCDTDFTFDSCDLSISQDLTSQLVLSYVSLSAEPNVGGSVNASFDNPNDGGAADCALEDQGEISGEFTQDLSIGDVVATNPSGINLGQVALDTTGIRGPVGAREATVFIYADYIPRDVRTLSFEIAVDAADMSIYDNMVVDRVLPSEGGIVRPEWTFEQTNAGAVDPGTGLTFQTFKIETGGLGVNPPIQYGSFGNMIRVDFPVIPDAVTEFSFRLLDVIPTTNNAEFRKVVHPDGIRVSLDETRRGPSFPTPEVGPTILDYGDTDTQQFFEIRNIGGTEVTDNIFLSWEILEGPDPTPYLNVSPALGQLFSTEDVFPVVVTLNRDKPETGLIDDTSFNITYTTGIEQVQGIIPVRVTGTILDPIMTITSADFVPATMTLDFGAVTEDLSFTIQNTGQSTLLWFVSNGTPPWLRVVGTTSVPQSEPAGVEVAVSVNRDQLTALDVDGFNMFNRNVVITGITAEGRILSNQTIIVTGQGN